MERRVPQSEKELLARASSLTQHTLGTLADLMGVPRVHGRVGTKGYVGELIEQVLGATAGNESEPDFPQLGIELKTLPLAANGLPKESTFVCTFSLLDAGRVSWVDSPVFRKLRRVLWVPVEADPRLPIPLRRIGSPMLWSPSAKEDQVLRNDFENLSMAVANGKIAQLTAHAGQWLQLRPKGADSRARTLAPDGDGGTTSALPRGFYLRRTMTIEVIRGRYSATYDGPRPGDASR